MTTKAVTVYEEFKLNLSKMDKQFAAVLPTHIPPEKFIRVALTAIQLRPELLNADRHGLFGELMKCAADGLIPDGREATINVYGNAPKYLPMIGGICKKARNSGEIATIDAQVVYKNDKFESWTDERGPHFKHVKERGDRGEPILPYAYALTKDGGFYFEEVDEKQMAAIESASKAKTGPWKGPFRDEMKRKSALRRLAKYRLPSSADLDDVIRRDEDLFDVDKSPVPEPTPSETKSSRLGNIIDAQTPPPVDPPQTTKPASAKVDQPKPVTEPSEPNEDPNVDEVPI